MVPSAPPEAAPSPVLLVHGEPLPFLAEQGVVTCRSQTLPCSISMSNYIPTAPIHWLVKQNEPGLPQAGILGTESAPSGQESIVGLTQAGPHSDSNHDCIPISVLPQSPSHLPLPKLPPRKSDLGMEGRFDPSNTRGKFWGEKAKLIFHSNITNNKTREEQRWKYAK